jgi:ATP-dependent Clp protease ATP-binding subunit ClpA
LDENKELPIRYLFIGSKNSGKVYLSKKLSESLHRPFSYFDMNYYKDESSFHSLLHSNLSSLVMEHPNAVILFHHFDKGYKEKCSIFERILDSGEVEYLNKDNNVDTISCRNNIFIFLMDTSNEMVSNLLNKMNHQFFSKEEETSTTTLLMMDELNEFRFYITPMLKNEYLKEKSLFLEKMNLIVPFFYFSKNELLNELNVLLKNIQRKGKEKKNLTITYSENVLFFLIKKYRPTISLTSLVENYILNVFTLKEIKQDDAIHLDVDFNREEILVMNSTTLNHYFEKVEEEEVMMESKL